jgi:hypothetical protein
MNHSLRPDSALFKDLAAQAQQIDDMLACQQLEWLHYAFEKRIATYTKEQLVFLRYHMLNYQQSLQSGEESLIAFYLRLIKYRLHRLR